MTYRIEITADSMTELAGKLLAITSQFHVVPDPVMPEVRDAAPAPAKAPKAKKEVAEEPVGEPVASTAANPSPTSNDAPGTQTAETAPVPSEPVELDFDKDITPLVLRVVKEKGKPVVQDILAQFGVERASQVDEQLWPELVAALEGELA
jgi:hypothetical protein